MIHIYRFLKNPVFYLLSEVAFLYRFGAAVSKGRTRTPSRPPLRNKALRTLCSQIGHSIRGMKTLFLGSFLFGEALE